MTEQEKNSIINSIQEAGQAGNFRKIEEIIQKLTPIEAFYFGAILNDLLNQNECLFLRIYFARKINIP